MTQALTRLPPPLPRDGHVLLADGIIELTDIRVLYLEGFASWRAAAERLREALALLGSPDTPINPVQVSVGPSVPTCP